MNDDDLKLLLDGLLPTEHTHSKLLENPITHENYNDMKQIGNIGNLPSELKNPFKPDYVTDISVYTTKDLWGKWSARGSVEFKKGNTSGKQKFEGIDLIDVLRKIYTFINNL